ncbi:MAG: hypothetical protein WAL50_16625 [Kineosporiaceae bacterium]
MSTRTRRRASPAWEGRASIQVATLPGHSLYARHLSHPEGVDGVHRPTVGLLGAARRAGSFAPRWLAAHLDAVDVVHVLGLPAGTGREAAAATSAAIDAVRCSGTPLVVTAYHLSDPTGADPIGYADRLSELVLRADAVITLTPSAAEEIRVRWAVEALVMGHPHAVDFVRMRTPRSARRSGRRRVGAHLGSLRMPSDPVDFVDALTRAVRMTEGAELRLHLHESVADPGAEAYAPSAVRRIEHLVRRAGGTLLRHRPLTEARLWDHLFALDVSVIPGLFGSHSIWPEACADLGTQIVLPRSSHAVGQRPEPGAGSTFEVHSDVDRTAEELATALWTLHSHDLATRSDPQRRWAERVNLCEQHRGLYERLLHGGAAGAVRTG